MIDTKIIVDYFSKCIEAYDFARKYRYFKKRYSITLVEDVIFSISTIENTNLLGAIGILIQEEPGLIQDYLPGFIDRNINVLRDNICIDNENITVYMQIVYLCMMGLDEKACDNLSNQIFAGSIYKRNLPEYVEFENHEFVTKHYARFFLSAINKLGDNIGWKKHYCKIVKSIYSARNYDINWINYIEYSLRKNNLGYEIDEKSAREYFDLLCEIEQFQSARFFLDNFDGSKPILGLSNLELVELVYSLPSVELLPYGKWLYEEKIDANYSYVDWGSDVKRLNNDDNVLKWIDLTVYYNSLMDCVEQGDYKQFEKLLNKADNYTMYDLEKVKYMKQQVKSFAFILNNLIAYKKEEVMGFLKKIEKININEYSKARYLEKWNNLESITEEYNYEELLNILFRSYAVQEVVYIFMNSHLKNIIELEEFIKRCADVTGPDVSVLFDEYPIWGHIGLGDRLSSVRDKLFLTPINVATKASFADYIELKDTYGVSSKELKVFKQKMFRCEEGWYARNKESLELLRRGDLCTFYIMRYEYRVGILIYNISLSKKEYEKRVNERKNDYPIKLLAWLKDVQEANRYIAWNMDEPVYGVRHLHDDMILRNQIALEILRTAHALRNNIIELKEFIFQITRAPLEEINEFRYIPTQKSLDFFWEKDKSYIIKKEVAKLIKEIISSEIIPASLKKGVYLNTCARKYYDLYDVCRYIGQEFFIDSAEEPFVLAVKYEKCEEGVSYFSTWSRNKWSRNNTFITTKKIIYYGDVSNLTKGFIYLVELKEYDPEKQLFILNRVNLNKEDTEIWKKYLRKLRDIKKAVDNSDFDRIANEIKKYRIKVTSNEHIYQWTHELNLVFKMQNYSIETAIKTLGILKSTNPYVMELKNENVFKAEFENAYKETYENFLYDFHNNYNSVLGFCDLFFSSFLRLTVDKEKFFDDISKNQEDRDNIMRYCLLEKHYNC